MSPGALLTAEDMSRALGVPVTSHGGATAGPMPVGAVQFHGPDGEVAAMVMVLTGMPAKFAIRARHRYPALPGIGDEAYGGPGVAGAPRRGAVAALRVPVTAHPRRPPS